MNEIKRIEIGDKAPDFTLKDQHNKDASLSGLKGKKSSSVFSFPCMDKSLWEADAVTRK